LYLTPKSALIIESTIANKNAGQNPETAKSGTIFPARIIRRALMTREKSPSVTIVIGNVRMLMTGLINTLISAHTTAKTREPIKVTWTPGTRYAATMIDNADMIQWVIFME